MEERDVNDVLRQSAACAASNQKLHCLKKRGIYVGGCPTEKQKKTIKCCFVRRGAFWTNTMTSITY